MKKPHCTYNPKIIMKIPLWNDKKTHVDKLLKFDSESNRVITL